MFNIGTYRVLLCRCVFRFFFNRFFPTECDEEYQCADDLVCCQGTCLDDLELCGKESVEFTLVMKLRSGCGFHTSPAGLVYSYNSRQSSARCK